MTGIRRVTTGEIEGRSVFVADDLVEGVSPRVLGGGELHRMWSRNARPTLPDAGERPAQETFFPPLDGYRFVLFSIPPDRTLESPPGDESRAAAALKEIESVAPGLIGHFEPNVAGMHTTNTVDIEIVLSGQVTLELGGGGKKTLYAGDTILQNGTRHRWSNQGLRPCVIACVMIGAAREPSGG